MPMLQEISQSTWHKEGELKDLKAELSALDRKIQLSLKPIDQSEENKSEKTQKNNQPQNTGSYPIPERLKEYKDTMDERLVIASIPKYNSENQLKGVKL